MSTQFNIEKNQSDYANIQSKVKVSDLLSRLNEEKKIEKKLSSGVAAVSAVTVWYNFTI